MTTLPLHWQLKTVGEVGRIDLGRQRHPDWHTGPEMRPYLRVANVFEDHIDTTDVKTMDFSGIFERYRLHPGDVLLNEGQTPELLGRPAIYRGNPPNVAFTNSLLRFRAGPEVLPEWALLVFRRHMHFGRFTRESRITTNIAHLSAGRLKTVEFPVPSLEEQRRIVDILEDHLSRLDAAAKYVKNAQHKAVALRRSWIETAIRDVPNRFGSLAEVVEKVEAGRSFGAGGRGAMPEEWGIIKVSAMTWGSFQPDENKVVLDVARVNPAHEIHPGDVLVSRANTTAYVGASVYVEACRPRLLLSDKSLRLLPRAGVDPRWLQTVLSAASTRAQISQRATGTKDSMRNISQDALLSVRIPIPESSMQAHVLQAASAAGVAATRLLHAAKQSGRRSAALKRSLLEAAFSGRLTGGSPEVDQLEELSSV